MGRRIYIIPRLMNIEDSVKDAHESNCFEIVQGIPPRLVGIVDETSLPIVFEELEEPQPEPSRDLAAEIDNLKARIEKLEKK